jgi:hypothetical protein
MEPAAVPADGLATPLSPALGRAGRTLPALLGSEAGTIGGGGW